MSFGRYLHTASVLANGKVLVTGGQGSGLYRHTAELYDPRTGNWTITTSMHHSRMQHTASILANGQVLVTGGEDFHTRLDSAELYDPIAEV